MDYKSNGVRANLGLNVDTAAKIDSDGAELKLLGTGVTIGKKNRSKYSIRRSIS